MAKYSKRKKATKKPTRRRRRIGATALNMKSPLVKYGSIAAGFLLANTINTPLDRVVPVSVDPKIVAGAQVGLGAMLAFKKQQSALTTIGGGLLIGSGIKRAMAAFGIAGIGGYQSVPVVGRVGAYQNVPVIGGYRTAAVALTGYKTSPVALNGSSGLMG
jgi:hypothetical protein